LISFVFEYHHSSELIGTNLVESNVNAQLQRRPKVQRPPEEEPRFGILGSVQLVERTVITMAAVVGRI